MKQEIIGSSVGKEVVRANGEALEVQSHEWVYHSGQHVLGKKLKELLKAGSRVRTEHTNCACDVRNRCGVQG